MKSSILFLSMIVLFAWGCATTAQQSSSPTNAVNSPIRIPLTTKGNEAAWAQSVSTEVKDDGVLLATWDDTSEEWAGFGNPMVKDWQDTVDISTCVDCSLSFSLKGEGIDQVRVKLKAYDDPTDTSKNESKTLLLDKYYDNEKQQVVIPLGEFFRPEFPSEETRQIIFDTWQKAKPVSIEIGFPMVIEKNAS